MGTKQPTTKWAESEADLATWFEEFLTLRSWRWCHYRTSWDRRGWRTALSGNPGAPDYICVKGSRCIWVELKASGGRATEGQREWIEALRNAGQECYLWHPADRELIMQVMA